MFLGIDIGGTKISVCVGNSEGKLLVAQRFAITKATSSYPASLAKILKLSHSVIQKAGTSLDKIAAVGLAAPGSMDKKRSLLIAPTNLKSWGTVPIAADLKQHLGKPVRMLNDANACALAEQKFGSAKGVKNLIYLTNSTGMGGGIILNNQVIEGPNGTAGEVGHCVLNPDGPLCNCGLHGCFEAYCGGLSVARRVQAKLRAEKIKTRILEHAEGDIDKIAMPAILAALRENDIFAQQIWDEYIMRFAQGIGVLMMALNPEMVILGTIAIHAGDLLMQPLRQQLPRFVWPKPLESCHLTVSRLGSQIGDYSALAAALAEPDSQLRHSSRS